MAHLYRLRKRIDSAEDLLSVVRTMKAMAAVNIRQFEQASASVEAYDETVELGFQALLRSRPEMVRRARLGQRRRTGLIVLGSDQGMCGSFNEKAAQRAGSVVLRPEESNAVLVCGHRVVSLLSDYGVPRPDDVWELPASVEAIPGFVRRLLGRIEAWEAERGIERVVVVYNTTGSIAGFEAHMREVLPLDRRFLEGLGDRDWPSKRLPSVAPDHDTLFSSLVREHLFVSLYRACADSLAAENLARLTSMQSAQKNISERLDELRAAWRRQRQKAITSELLDIVAGYEGIEEG